MDDLLEFVLSVGNDGGVLGLEVPYLPAGFGSDGDPVAFGVEGQSSDGGLGVVNWLSLFNIAEVKNSDFQVLSTSHNEVSSGGDSKGINVGVVSLEGVLNAESLVVPDLKISIPSD